MVGAWISQSIDTKYILYTELILLLNVDHVTYTLRSQVTWSFK